MPAAAVATLVLAGLIVLAVAVVLVWVIVLLARISGALGRVDSHVATVGRRTEPIEPTVTAINSDLRDVADEFEGLTRGGADQQRRPGGSSRRQPT